MRTTSGPTRAPLRLRPTVRALAATGALALTASAWWLSEERSAPEAFAAGEDRPWSAQLHLHGPFSEGLGSIESQSHEAADVGLDVLWWSEHDWRLSGYHTLSRFSFEGGDPATAVAQDRLGDWELTDSRYEPEYLPELVTLPRRTEARGTVSRTDEEALEGNGSLKLTATGEGPEPSLHVARLRAPLPGYQRPLAAGLELSFSILPRGLDAGGQVWLEARLSEHPLSAEERRERPNSDGYPVTSVRYVLGSGEREPWRQGPTAFVPLEHTEGEWSTYRVALTEDALRLFGDLGEDNALSQLNLAAGAANGSTTVAYLDELVISAAHRGPEMLDRQTDLVERVGAGYPELLQHQGLEISYLNPHLNEFSLETPLFDYDRLVETSGLLDADRRVSEADLSAVCARAAVDRAHGRGGLISYNHCFGTAPTGSEARTTREQAADELLEHRLYGADLLEVGYRDRGGHALEDHLWVWDRLPLAGGLRPVGIGVSDHHGGPERWRTMPNNFVTWIWAPGPTKAELIEGLRAGRAWFGDLTLFDGSLDVTTDAGHRMGAVVVTDRERVELTLRVTGLAQRNRVTFVASGEAREPVEVRERELELRRTLELSPVGGFARFEIRRRSSRSVVFSNPVHFVRPAQLATGDGTATSGLTPARLQLDLGGVRSTDLTGIELSAVEALGEPGRPEGLVLTGSGTGGRLLLDCPGLTNPRIELEGLRGRIERIEGTVPRFAVNDLEGQGRLRLAGGP